MKFLLPVGGVIDDRFGILTTPSHKAIPIGIIHGMLWALDNEAFTLGFDPDRFFDYLSSLENYRDKNLFVACPDSVGDVKKTIALYKKWRPAFGNWNVAYVAQDGSENYPIPDDCTTVFIGGSTDWKLSQQAEDVIYRALDAGKEIHIGRVNYKKRYDHFSSMKGSEGWTCDGTRPRFEGTERAIIAWAEYMVAPRQLRLHHNLPAGNHTIEPDSN